MGQVGPQIARVGHVQSNTHMLTQCTNVREAWVWLRSVLDPLLPPNGGRAITDEDLLHLNFGKGDNEKTITFYIINFVSNFMKKHFPHKATSEEIMKRALAYSLAAADYPRGVRDLTNL